MSGRRGAVKGSEERERAGPEQGAVVDYWGRVIPNKRPPKLQILCQRRERYYPGNIAESRGGRTG